MESSWHHRSVSGGAPWAVCRSWSSSRALPARAALLCSTAALLRGPAAPGGLLQACCALGCVSSKGRMWPWGCVPEAGSLPAASACQSAAGQPWASRGQQMLRFVLCGAGQGLCPGADTGPAPAALQEVPAWAGAQLMDGAAVCAPPTPPLLPLLPPPPPPSLLLLVLPCSSAVILAPQMSAFSLAPHQHFNFPSPIFHCPFFL